MVPAGQYVVAASCFIDNENRVAIEHVVLIIDAEEGLRRFGSSRRRSSRA
jgi:hypothetical protein